MTSTPDLRPLGGCDDPASVLGYARDRKTDEDQAAREVMIAGAKYASMHTEDSLVGPVETWHESCLPLGGPGCPGVAEFAVTELAAALGKSPEAGRRFLARCVEGFYRLPDCWERLQAGQLEAWRLGMIADATMCLSRDAAEFVDTHVAPVAHRIGQAPADAAGRGGPGEVRPRADRGRPAGGRGRPALRRRARPGVLRRDGARRGRPGPGRRLRPQHRGRPRVASELLRARVDRVRWVSAGPRRSGDLARAQLALGFTRPPRARPKPTGPSAGRWCCTPTSPPTRSPAPPATGGQPTWPGSRRSWPRSPPSRSGSGAATPNTKVTVKPVLDLAEHIWVMSYEASDRLKDQTRLRDGTCAHPWCTRAAVRCDCEHRVPHDRDHPERGPTCSCNLAPTCRPHHRAKTTGGWTYVTLEPGTYLWRITAGLPVPPRPHRHHRRHPRRRPTPLRPRAHRPLR